jgi:ABC-type arginine transport system permease subunit
LARASVAETYTTVIRGIPDLVLMLLIFFQGQIMLNNLGAWTGAWDYVEIDPMIAGVMHHRLHHGRLLHGDLPRRLPVDPIGPDRGRRRLRHEPRLIFRRIIWPQLVRYALPSFTNNWLVQLEDHGAGEPDRPAGHRLQRQRHRAEATREPFTFLFAALLFFLVLTAISEIVLRYLDRRYSAGVRRA